MMWPAYDLYWVISELIGREVVDELGQAVNSVALSNDENCVLASCLDSTIRLLDRCSQYPALALL
jgi:hypothetical protein